VHLAARGRSRKDLQRAQMDRSSFAGGRCILGVKETEGSLCFVVVDMLDLPIYESVDMEVDAHDGFEMEQVRRQMNALTTRGGASPRTSSSHTALYIS
jgi:hypothetical protein